MKIAVPTTNNNMIDSHFGHCEFFTVFTVENNKVADQQRVTSPEECGCKSGIASVLAEMGVSVMLAGNMGPGAVNVLNSSGIDVYRGCQGGINKVVEDFINGEIEDSGISCSHSHAHGENCHNN